MLVAVAACLNLQRSVAFATDHVEVVAALLLVVVVVVVGGVVVEPLSSESEARMAMPAATAPMPMM